jgi:hypothetical protein
MWRFFQCLAMFLVIASNIHWQWTDSPQVAAIAGGAAAYASTMLLHWLGLTPRSWRRRRRRPSPSF